MTPPQDDPPKVLITGTALEEFQGEFKQARPQNDPLAAVEAFATACEQAGYNVDAIRQDLRRVRALIAAATRAVDFMEVGEMPLLQTLVDAVQNLGVKP